MRKTSQSTVGTLPATVNGVYFKAGGVILLPHFIIFNLYLWEVQFHLLRSPGTVAGFSILIASVTLCNSIADADSLPAIALEIYLWFYQAEMSQFKLGTQRHFFPAQPWCCRIFHPTANTSWVLHPCWVLWAQLAGQYFPSWSLEKLLCLLKTLLTLWSSSQNLVAFVIFYFLSIELYL